MTLILLLVISARLVQLQGFEAEAYEARGEGQRLSTVTIPATRGPITDRNGQELAITVEARSVYVDPGFVRDAAEKKKVPLQQLVREQAAVLAPLLGVSEEHIRAQSTKSGRFQYLAKGLSPDQGDKVRAAIEEHRIAGVALLADRKRVYPAGELAANVVGFVGADGQALGGFEYAFDELLAGTDGAQTREIAQKLGTTIPVGHRVVEPAIPGTGVQLTIDRDIQWRAQQLLADKIDEVGAESGSVIVTDVRSGEVLALAVAPTFDANAPGDADPDALGNPAVSNVYEPGSVNKVITIAAALEHGLVGPRSRFEVPWTHDYKGRTFHDSHQHEVQHLTTAGILATSSNVGTIKIAEKLGGERLYAAMRAFGFGEESGIDFPGEARGILPAPDEWSNSTLPTMSFGQGVSATALQVASVYATVANGGVRVTPTLVSGHIAADGTVTAAPEPESRRVISEEVASQLRTMLEQVTLSGGTATTAGIEGYRVAGKTGTAQLPKPGGGYYSDRYVSSFVGFAPADDPQLLVSVVLHGTKRGLHYGGVVAAPVFKDVMQFALQTRRIPPTGTTPRPFPLTYDPRR